MDITALFVCIDDFCKLYEENLKHKLITDGSARCRSGYLSLSEMLFIEIYYHFSGFRNFKTYYKTMIYNIYRSYFKRVPCYERFVLLRQKLIVPLSILLHSLKGEKTGLYYIDSTSLKVCHNKRISRHKTMKEFSGRGKSSMGWFYGLKLHLVINEKSEIIALKITSGNSSDSSVAKEILKNLRGKCFGDKGYLGKKLFTDLWKNGLQLITGIRSNMKNYLLPYLDKILHRKRFKIETLFGKLKNNFNLEHTRHRSPQGFFVNILSALSSYSISIYLNLQ